MARNRRRNNTKHCRHAKKAWVVARVKRGKNHAKRAWISRLKKYGKDGETAAKPVKNKRSRRSRSLAAKKGWITRRRRYGKNGLKGKRMRRVRIKKRKA